jgi:hypothetical protein
MIAPKESPKDKYTIKKTDSPSPTSYNADESFKNT